MAFSVSMTHPIMVAVADDKIMVRLATKVLFVYSYSLNTLKKQR